MNIEEKRKYDRDYHANRTPEAKARKMQIQLERRRLNRKLLDEYKAEMKCKCGESHPACLEFHHENNDKEGNVSDLMTRSFSKIMEEVKKCVVLCANCHRKLHFILE